MGRERDRSLGLLAVELGYIDQPTVSRLMTFLETQAEALTLYDCLRRSGRLHDEQLEALREEWYRRGPTRRLASDMRERLVAEAKRSLPAERSDELLGYLLLNHEMLTPEQLRVSRSRAGRGATRLGVNLVELGLLSRELVLRGYGMVHQYFTVCTDCGVRQDLRSARPPACLACGGAWYEESSAEHLSGAMPAPSPPSVIAAPAPCVAGSERADETEQTAPSDASDPFAQPVGYSGKASSAAYSGLLATSSINRSDFLPPRGDVASNDPNEALSEEGMPASLSLSTDELSLFTNSSDSLLRERPGEPAPGVEGASAEGWPSPGAASPEAGVTAQRRRAGCFRRAAMFIGAGSCIAELARYWLDS